MTGRELGIGLVGSGFMGRAHALAFRSVGGVYDLPARPRLELLADQGEEAARRAADRLGFRRATGDWMALVNDPGVDVVAIATPNATHRAIALAAIAGGKAVYCEKPLATSVADAREMADAADAAGAITMVGFNYLHNPMIALAREIVQGGEIGEVTGFRGIHAEGFMADPMAPFSWRCEPEGGGALADVGSHIISLTRHLVGGIDAVCGRLDTAYRRRPVAAGSTEMREVAVDDQANALLRLASGATGSLSASWIASGRTMQLAFELTGSHGSISFTQERFNELRLFKAGRAGGRGGFTHIVAGPEHGDYAAFCPAPGHQIGFGDLKTIEVSRLLRSVADGAAAHPDFREACEVERVADAIRRSAREERWVTVRG
jgi:predicted dehydrogenase